MRLMWLAVGLLVAGCGQGTSVVEPAVPRDPAAEQADDRARDVLDRWEAEIGTDGSGLRFVQLGGPLTRVGEWEPGKEGWQVAADGLAIDVAPGVELPADDGPGEVRWADGSAIDVGVLPADAVVWSVRDRAKCLDCHGVPPLQVTGATRTEVTVRTDRGEATAPGWELTLAGTAVRLTVPAVAPPASVGLQPLPWETQIGALGGQEASLSADGRTLTVHFGGAAEGTGPCTAEYTARAVESEQAVVAIIEMVPHGRGEESCWAVAHPRTAPLTLAEPLGTRTLLDLGQGLPISVRR